jgi:hypothetical protein
MSLEEPFGSKEEDWARLIGIIKKGNCLPFIGPGLCRGCYLPKAKLAEKWAESYDYPFQDKSDLARVAQFMEVKADAYTESKEQLRTEFSSENKPPNFRDEWEPHRVLADLHFPIYVTTNYDNYMKDALDVIPTKSARREYCNWRKPEKVQQQLQEQRMSGQWRQPINIANPLVFHLYGHIDATESLILSEMDYMKFLINVVKYPCIIPSDLQSAMVSKAMMFLGYELDDWDFRILLAVLDRFVESQFAGMRHVSVQIAPCDKKSAPPQQEKAREHFRHYLDKNFNVSVYWGTCEDFTRELRRRWKD